MRLQILYGVIFLCSIARLEGLPIVQSIKNNSEVGFAIVSHSDNSACSFHGCGKVIEAHHVFKQDFLLEKGKPSLILRPIYYVDPISKKKLYLVNNENQFDEEKIKRAYKHWKLAGNKGRFAHSLDWLHRWVGEDIEVKPHTTEVLGYLINLSRVKIHNSGWDHGTWLSFSKGVFSRLILDITIAQHRRKGIIPYIKVAAGEGGICRNGIVERLF